MGGDALGQRLARSAEKRGQRGREARNVNGGALRLRRTIKQMTLEYKSLGFERVEEHGKGTPPTTHKRRNADGRAAMQPPTKRQREVLDFVNQFARTHGYPPTRSEIAKHLSVTQPTIDSHIKALAERGLLEVSKGRSRAIRVRTPDDVPLVALGEPQADQGTVSGRFAERFEPRPEFFAEAVDDTMSGAGIRCGDLMAVKAETNAQNGDIVIAQLTTGRCCRRLERLANSMVRLSTMPASAARPIKLDEAALRIDGIVIGTIAFRPVER